jgi:AhpD family alkylhydroperoxidase
MNNIPKRYKKFSNDFPEVIHAYETLGEAVHSAGPLNEKTRALIKLAISIGGKLEGAVHAHTRKARNSGATPNEIRHVALLALPTIGLPSMMAAMSWIDDILDEQKT